MFSSLSTLAISAAINMTISITPTYSHQEEAFEFPFHTATVQTDWGYASTLKRASFQANRYCRNDGARDLQSRRYAVKCEEEIMKVVSYRLAEVHAGG